PRAAPRIQAAACRYRRWVGHRRCTVVRRARLDTGRSKRPECAGGLRFCVPRRTGAGRDRRIGSVHACGAPIRCAERIRNLTLSGSYLMSNMKMQIETMQGAADRACELLKAMANRHRLLILCQLVERERSVGELAELLGIRDSGVSQHLTLLRKDGLVSARREGQTIWYALASKEVR